MTIRTEITLKQRKPRNCGCIVIGRIAAWCSVIAMMFSGCAMTNGRHYTFRTMPVELFARRQENVQTLDLTQLARVSNDSDVIDRGDVVEVTISTGLDEKETITMPVRVNDQGVANIPEVGPIQTSGMTLQAVEGSIKAACIERQFYRNPNVTVTMKRQRMNRVMVVGAVNEPDVYELPRGKSNLLAALVAAGGLAKDAGTRIEIRNPRRNENGGAVPIASGLQPAVRAAGHSVGMNGTDSNSDIRRASATSVTGSEAGMDSIQVDLVSATKSTSGDYSIDDGGVVSVEKRDPEPLHVMGLVKKPDRYDFPIAEELRVTDAIALAGGTSLSPADKVFVIRHIPNSDKTAIIQVSLREAKQNSQANVRLEPSDIVSVESTPTTVLFEAINIVRFSFSAGLPLAGFF